MKATFLNRGKLVQLNDVAICARNFSGDKFGKGGKPSFGIRFPGQEYDPDCDAATTPFEDMPVVNKLLYLGYPVNLQTNDDGSYSCVLYAKLSIFDDSLKTNIFVQSGERSIPYNKIAMLPDLDRISVDSIDVDIKSSEYNVNGRSGVTAYATGLWIQQHIDRFTERFNDMESRWKKEHMNVDGVDEELPFV